MATTVERMLHALLARVGLPQDIVPRYYWDVRGMGFDEHHLKGSHLALLVSLVLTIE